MSRLSISGIATTASSYLQSLLYSQNHRLSISGIATTARKADADRFPCEFSASAFLESRRLLEPRRRLSLSPMSSASAFLESRRLLARSSHGWGGWHCPPQHFWNRDDC